MSNKALRLAVACAVSLSMASAVIPAVTNLTGISSGAVLADGVAPPVTEGDWVLRGNEEESFNYSTLTLTGDLTLHLQGYYIDFETINTNGYKFIVTSDSTEGNIVDKYGYLAVGTLNVNGGEFEYDITPPNRDEYTSNIDKLKVTNNASAYIKANNVVSIDSFEVASSNGQAGWGNHSVVTIGDNALVIMADDTSISLSGDYTTFINNGILSSVNPISVSLNDYSHLDNSGTMTKSNIVGNGLGRFTMNTNKSGTLPGSLEAGSTVTLNGKSSFGTTGPATTEVTVTMNGEDVEINGSIKGDVVVNAGKTGMIKGVLNGSVTLNNNSSLTIYGTVNGDVVKAKNTDVVSLTIDNEGKLNNTSPLDFGRTASTITLNGSVNYVYLNNVNNFTVDGANVAKTLYYAGAQNVDTYKTIKNSSINTLQLSVYSNIRLINTEVTDYANMSGYVNLESSGSTFSGTKLVMGTDVIASFDGDTFDAPVQLIIGSEATFTNCQFNNAVTADGSDINVVFADCSSSEDGTITITESAVAEFKSASTSEIPVAAKMEGLITIDGTLKYETFTPSSVTVDQGTFTTFSGGFLVTNGATADVAGGIFDTEFITVNKGSELELDNARVDSGIEVIGDGTASASRVNISSGSAVFAPVYVTKAILHVTSGATIHATGNAIIADEAVQIKVTSGTVRSTEGYCIYDSGVNDSMEILVTSGRLISGINIDTPIMAGGNCQDYHHTVMVTGGFSNTKFQPQFVPEYKLQVLNEDESETAGYDMFEVVRFEPDLDYYYHVGSPATCCIPGTNDFLSSYKYGDYLPYTLLKGYVEATDKEKIIPAQGHDYHDADDATLDIEDATWHFNYTDGTKQHYVDSAYLTLRCSKCGEVTRFEDKLPVMDQPHEGINTYHFTITVDNINHPDVVVTNDKSIRYAPNVYMQVSAGSTFVVKLVYVFPVDYDFDDTDMMLYYESKFNGEVIDDFEGEIKAVFNRNVGEETGYVMSVSSPAKDMTKNISFSIEGYDDEGPIVDDAKSIRDYAKMLINDTEGVFPGNNDDVRNFCRAMLSYGHAAQDQFDTVTGEEDYADYGVTGTGLDYSGVEVPTEEFDKDTLNSILGSVNAPVSYYGMSATLKSNPYFTLIFKCDPDKQNEALKWVKDRIVISRILTYTSSSVDVKVTASGDRYIKVVTPELNISNISQLYGIKVLGANNSNPVEFGLNTFVAGVNAMQQSDSKTKMLNLCKSLINYYNYSRVLIDG